LMKGLIGF